MNELRELLKQNIDTELLVKLTCDMVRIESHSQIPGMETGVAKYIKKYFDAVGIPSYIKGLQDGRSNIIAELDSGNPGRTLILNGHMDTVKADGMPDAFEPHIEDGKLYGRGASDMKGPLASIMIAMTALKKTGALKAGKVIFTGVADEEMDSIGTIDILESGITADAAIVCEPSELKVKNGNRGLEWFEFHFKGKAVHGGEMDKGVNAILKATDFINAVREKVMPQAFKNGGLVNIGVINGGTQLSTVPGECDLLIDRRYTEKESLASITEEFRTVMDELSSKDPDFRCEWKPMSIGVMKDGYTHGAAYTPLDADILRIVRKYSEEFTGSCPVEFFKAWTDAGILSTFGNIPSVIIGPGLIECCHALHEYIPVDHLPKAALIYALTAVEFCCGEGTRTAAE